MKNHNIRIFEATTLGYSFQTLEFDSLDELRNILKKYGKAEKLVPVTLTYMDTIEFMENRACNIDEISILYLYDYVRFRVE